jgi:hypothetical protein
LAFAESPENRKERKRFSVESLEKTREAAEATTMTAQKNRERRCLSFIPRAR